MASTNPSDGPHAWVEALAALELVQFKHQSPTRTECRAAGALLSVILEETDTTDSARPNKKSAAKKIGNSFKVSATTAFDVVPSTTMPMPLATGGDAEFLSPQQSYIRLNAVEYFEATKSDAVPRGRQTAVAEGRVGVRCAFCGHLPRSERASQATSFPNQLASIYSSVVMIQCRHFPVCREMPDDVREDLAQLKKKANNVPNNAKVTRQSYWVDSARELGLVDTDGGVRFVPPRGVRSTAKPGKALAGALVASTKAKATEVKTNTSAATTLDLARPAVVSPFEPIISIGELRAPIHLRPLMGNSTLVYVTDRGLVPDHVFIAFAQLLPTKLTNCDRIGAYQTYPIGFLGMCCKYCGGEPGPGQGRFFPNSRRSLAQTTTTQTIVKHITTKCKHVPQNVKDAVTILLKEANEDDKPTYAPKKSAVDDGRPKFGSRKMFFQNVWDRLHSPQAAGGPVATVSFGGKMIRPTPIRKTSSIEDEFDGEPLFDDKDRRVTITLHGHTFTTNDEKKRAGAFIDSTVPTKKSRV